ncbi:hypothetical protein [Hymenobacter sp. B81]|uniref:hypothetical protein n=1 Tax=Hymenobacter sp. B81 TaxID=3344878 RepID=UPI0037DDB109
MKNHPTGAAQAAAETLPLVATATGGPDTGFEADYRPETEADSRPVLRVGIYLVGEGPEVLLTGHPDIRY